MLVEGKRHVALFLCACGVDLTSGKYIQDADVGEVLVPSLEAYVETNG